MISKDERAIINRLAAGVTSVDCWVWDVNKQDGYHTIVWSFGNTSKGILFGTQPNGTWCKHAEFYNGQDIPKMQYRKWTADTCPLQFGDELIDKHNSNRRLVFSGYESDRKSCKVILCDFGIKSFGDLMIDYTLPDGSPCGEKIEEDDNE